MNMKVGKIKGDHTSMRVTSYQYHVTDILVAVTVVLALVIRKRTHKRLTVKTVLACVQKNMQVESGKHEKATLETRS